MLMPCHAAAGEPVGRGWSAPVSGSMPADRADEIAMKKSGQSSPAKEGAAGISGPL